MNSVIRAATLLMALTAPAAAEITIEGEARMGLSYDGGRPADDRTRVIADERVTITKTIKADNGITFKAVIELDSSTLPGGWRGPPRRR